MQIRFAVVEKNTSGIRQTLIEQWNGTNWTVINSPNIGSTNNYLYGIAVLSASNIWAVGYYEGSNDNQTLLEHSIDGGKTWTASTQGPGYLSGITRVSANEAWAVGDDLRADLTAHLIGSTWNIVIDQTQNFDLNSVSAHAANDVWAVGDDPNGQPVTLHYGLDKKWTPVTTPSPGQGSRLFGVTARATNDVWAVGDGESETTGFLIHWNAHVMRNEMTTSRQKKKREFSQGKEGEGKEDGNT